MRDLRGLGQSSGPAAAPDDLCWALNKYGAAPRRIVRHASPTRCKVYEIETARGRFGLKVYPPDYSRADLETEVAFARHLAGRGLPVCRFLDPPAPGLYAEAPDGRRAAMYEWFNGDVRDAYLPGDLEALAKTIGAIHAASSDVRLHRGDDWLWRDARICLDYTRPPAALARRLRRIVEAGKPPDFAGRLLMAHSDYGIKNAVWSDVREGPAIIDFTNAISAPPEWDLAGLCADACLRGGRARVAVAAADIVRHYVLSATPPDFSRLWRLFPVAIAHRSIFLARTADESAYGPLWDRSLDLLDDLDRGPEG